MLQELVRNEVVIAVEIARSAFPNVNITIPRIKFSNRMTSTGGTCRRKGGVWIVTFSLPIMRDNDINEYISQVVYHEVAHMVDKLVYGGWGHGASFYQVLRGTFGKVGREGGRTHSFKTAPKKRRAREFEYVCEHCKKVYNFTAIRHNRSLDYGGRAYTHKCPNGRKGYLEYAG